MENSAKVLTFPSWARLKRDKGNYQTWRKHVFDYLQASGCEQAISPDFSQLAYDSDSDSDASDTDLDDDFSSFTLGGEQRKHDPFPQASPTSSQEQLEAKISALLQSKKKARQQKRREKKRAKKKKKFEEKKRQIDAKARTLIRSTIDAKAFAPSTHDCETAYDLWMALQPAEGYTEEVHRALGML